MDITARVNDDLLIQGPDTRAAWIIFNPAKALVTVVTDPQELGAPYNAASFTSADLREIADRLDELTARRRMAS